MQAPEPTEEVVFGNSIEALFVRALGDKLSKHCRARLAEAGIDVRRVLPFYPRKTFFQCLRILAEELYPDMDDDRALFEIGLSFMRGFEETLIGKALIGALKVMGPRRSLAKMTRNFRSANNYLEAELKELGPELVELTLNQISGAPSYFEGVLTAGLRYAGAKDVRIERRAEDGARCTYRLSWSSQ